MLMYNVPLQAGIAKNQLKLALEPEAAAILCKQVALSKDKEESEVKAFQPGSKFMVVDCGGTCSFASHLFVFSVHFFIAN